MNMTRREIIDDTLGYYVGHPERFSRTETGGCRYRTSDDRMCAIGRHLNPNHERYLDLVADNPAAVSIEDGMYCPLDVMLNEPVRGHSIYFWQALQKLHDEKEFWDEKAQLTPAGQRHLKMLQLDVHDKLLYHGTGRPDFKFDPDNDEMHPVNGYALPLTTSRERAQAVAEEEAARYNSAPRVLAVRLDWCLLRTLEGAASRYIDLNVGCQLMNEDVMGFIDPREDGKSCDLLVFTPAVLTFVEES